MDPDNNFLVGFGSENFCRIQKQVFFRILRRKFLSDPVRVFLSDLETNIFVGSGDDFFCRIRRLGYFCWILRRGFFVGSGSDFFEKKSLFRIRFREKNYGSESGFPIQSEQPNGTGVQNFFKICTLSGQIWI